MEECPAQSFADRSSSVILTLVVPDADHRSDDEVTHLMNDCKVPEQAEKMEVQVPLFCRSDVKHHVGVGFVVSHFSR